MPVTKSSRALVDEATAEITTYTTWVEQGGPTETLEQQKARRATQK